jgi:hypothetical protein
LRLGLASLPNLPNPGMLRILLIRKIGSKQNFLSIILGRRHVKSLKLQNYQVTQLHAPLLP